MSTRLAAKKSAEGSDTEEESELATAILNQEARLEGLRIAGEELEERLKRDLIASLKESEARQDVSATKEHRVCGVGGCTEALCRLTASVCKSGPVGGLRSRSSQ